MQQREVTDLAANGFFEGEKLKGKFEETHISWVILTRRFAFKIKKPVKLSFLDFTNLRDRKHYCQRELLLNRRFTDIYISCLAVRATAHGFSIGDKKGKVVDYAVQMKRMAGTKRMDKLLEAGRVKAKDIISLAKVVANAHSNCKPDYTPFNLAEAKNLFNDVKQIQPFLEKNTSKEWHQIVDDALLWNESFLKKHSRRFQARIDQGFKRDVHGDLHSGNIFLYKKPVLFDCIEFNDSFRQIDVLYEVAFLCMDLEGYGMKEFSKEFMLVYNTNFPSIEIFEDFELFNYFKCLRANVRAKVNAYAAAQTKNNEEFLRHIDEMKKYLTLMHSYTIRSQA